MCDRRNQCDLDMDNSLGICTFKEGRFPITYDGGSFTRNFTAKIPVPCYENSLANEGIYFCQLPMNITQCNSYSKSDPDVCVFKKIGLPKDRIGCQCTEKDDIGWKKGNCGPLLTECSEYMTCRELTNSFDFCAFKEGKAPITTTAKFSG